MEIIVEIPGKPVPQPRARSTRGGRMYTPTKNGIDVYKQAAAMLIAADARRQGITISEVDAFVLSVECVFSRPPSHFKASGALRETAPRWPFYGVGDWDNLVKGVQDSIKPLRIIWKDDAQVVDGRGWKRYAERGEQERTVITIRRLPP